MTLATNCDTAAVDTVDTVDTVDAVDILDISTAGVMISFRQLADV